MANTATILLVEDDLTLLEGVADLLELGDLGYEARVLMAPDGQAALDILEEELPDLVITDIVMPAVDGYALLKRLRARTEWAHIPVIFLTAHGHPQDVRTGRASGAELYVTKPFEGDELLDLVRGQLERTLQLRRDQQMQHEALGRSIIEILTHELRTPLTYVTAYGQMLSDRLLSQETVQLKEYLHGIAMGAARLDALVEDLLLVVALRTGEAAKTFSRRSARVDNLPGLLREWCRQEQTGARMGPVTLQWSLPETLPPVAADVDYLQDVFRRLLDNAAKFSRPQSRRRGRVTVSAGVHEGQVYIKIEDNGIGFPDCIREQIFDLFYQHDRQAMEQQGAGCGLTIVRGLVELHGGRVSAYGEPDRGSTFIVSLPVAGAGAPLPGAVSPVSVGRQATVLIAEDERLLLEGTKEMLELIKEPYALEVLTAPDGASGLEMVARRRPDLIISDIIMPGLDGYDFLAAVRANPQWVDIPFIFLTVRGSQEDIIRGRRSGAEEYVTKPFDGRELYDLVTAKLDRYFQRQERMRHNFEELKRGILKLLLPEFRLPIRCVSELAGELGLRLDETQDDAGLASYLKEIQGGSRQIQRFVDDFIFLVELRSGDVAAAWESRARAMGGRLLFRQLAELWTSMAEAHGLSLNCDLDDELPLLQVDAELLSKGLQRLWDLILGLDRRLNSSGPACRTSVQGGEVRLKITLPGACFDEGHLEQCRALLASPETDMIGLSQGDLGLLIARDVIEAHGGRLTLFATPGSGCEFQLALPAYRPVAATAVQF
jgi:two-component system, sensor histidine kinase and response regulator